MFLYTTQKPEQILPQNTPTRLVRRQGNVFLDIDPTTGTLTRVFSTDPKVYLDPRFQPGSKR